MSSDTRRPERSEDEKAEDIITVALALHAAGIRCSPNVPYCRATHIGPAVRFLNALDDDWAVVRRDSFREATDSEDDYVEPPSEALWSGLPRSRWERSDEQ